MEFRDVVRRRRMVRNYDPARPVPPEVRERLLAHAVRAPSAGFSQGWAFLVLEEPADRERFWRSATGPGGARSARAGVGTNEAPSSLVAPVASLPTLLSPDDAGPDTGPGGARSARAAPDTGAWSRWLRDMRTAPLIVVVHSNKRRYLDRYAEPDKGWTDRDEARWPVPYWHIDAGFAGLLMLLTAVDDGLGACFFGIPPERTAAYRSEFGVPEDFDPIGAVSVGYPAADHRSGSLARGHRPLDEVVHRGQWGGPSAAGPVEPSR